MTEADRPHNLLEAKLVAYPDLYVARINTGDILVARNITESLERQATTTFILEQITKPAVMVLSLIDNDHGTASYSSRMDMKVRLVNDDAITVDVVNRKPGVDVPEELEKVRQGYEIFTTFMEIPVDQRRAYRDRVADGMIQWGNMMEEDELLQGDTIFQASIDPANNWRLFQWTLKKEVKAIQDSNE